MILCPLCISRKWWLISTVLSWNIKLASQPIFLKYSAKTSRKNHWQSLCDKHHIVNMIDGPVISTLFSPKLCQTPSNVYFFVVTISMTRLKKSSQECETKCREKQERLPLNKLGPCNWVWGKPSHCLFISLAWHSSASACFHYSI